MRRFVINDKICPKYIGLYCLRQPCWDYQSYTNVSTIGQRKQNECEMQDVDKPSIARQKQNKNRQFYSRKTSVFSVEMIGDGVVGDTNSVAASAGRNNNTWSSVAASAGKNGRVAA